MKRINAGAFKSNVVVLDLGSSLAGHTFLRLI
jgi:hypothetical protein